jgi:serine/tyrosine/threonine adenylyltransferase
LIEQVEPLQQALNSYVDSFEQGWQTMMASKLGLNTFDSATDDELTTDLLQVLSLVETDMTLFYRKLALIDTRIDLNYAGDDELIAVLLPAYYVPEQVTCEYKMRLFNWLRSYIKRVRTDGTPDDIRRDRMNAVNPNYVLRNYLAQLAIDKAEQGDYSMIHELLELLRHPYDEQPGKETWAAKRPDWARQRAGCSMLSCSS